MADLDFPSNPIDGQEHVGANGVTYVWNAAKTRWDAKARVVTDPVIPESDGELRNMVVYDAPGTYTYTKPAGLKRVKVTVIGGGGGGGSGSTSYGASAGGGGGTAIRLIEASILSATETVVVGSGGSGAPAGGYNGANGTDSSFGSHCSATGGKGGVYTGSIAEGGDGGMGSGGDLNIPGGRGSRANDIHATDQGRGGGTYLCPNVDFQVTYYGAGGCYSRGSGTTGLKGGDGVVIIEEYF